MEKGQPLSASAHPGFVCVVLFPGFISFRIIQPARGISWFFNPGAGRIELSLQPRDAYSLPTY
jgi:hypothetical protein